MPSLLKLNPCMALILSVRTHLRILLKLSRLINWKQSDLIIKTHVLYYQGLQAILEATLYHHKSNFMEKLRMIRTKKNWQLSVRLVLSQTVPFADV